MNRVQSPVITNDRILPGVCRAGARNVQGTWLIWLQAPDIARDARPGQYVMVGCGPEAVLPRPFSLHDVSGGRIALLYNELENGRGTGWLSRRRPGDSVALFGPLGHGFSVRPDARRLLLVAGGIGVAPLRFLADAAIEQGKEVILLMGAASAGQLCPSGLLPSGAGLLRITEDGSEGERGLVTQYLPGLAGKYDQVMACGPLAMYRAMARLGGPAQVSLETRMGCGLGTCYGCTVNTRQGLRQVCRDGPVFELGDIIWDKLIPG